MAAEVVLAVYRPKRGREKDLLRILRRHVRVLRKERLATKRPVVLLRSRKTRAIVEIFEWADATAAARAHSNPAVGRVWTEMAEVATCGLPLAKLHEADAHFAHFEPIDGVIR